MPRLINVFEEHIFNRSIFVKKPLVTVTQYSPLENYAQCHFSVQKPPTIFCIFRPDRLVSDLHKNLYPSTFSITTENFDKIEGKRRKSSSAQNDVNIRFSAY